MRASTHAVVPKDKSLTHSPRRLAPNPPLDHHSRPHQLETLSHDGEGGGARTFLRSFLSTKGVTVSWSRKQSLLPPPPPPPPAHFWYYY